jgi:hypothetical protein
MQPDLNERLDASRSGQAITRGSASATSPSGVSASGQAITRGSATVTSGKGRTFTFWIGPDRRERLERLKEKGMPVDVAKTCQAAVDQALEAGEKALTGDRLARLLARVKATRTRVEQAEAEGEAAGRAWAEDVAALSEMRRIRNLLEEHEKLRLEAMGVEVVGDMVFMQRIHWPTDGQDCEPWEPTILPSNVPRDFLTRAVATSDEGNIPTQYTAPLVNGFLRGASAVLTEVEEALRREAEERAIQPMESAPTTGKRAVKMRKRPSEET